MKIKYIIAAVSLSSKRAALYPSILKGFNMQIGSYFLSREYDHVSKETRTMLYRQMVVLWNMVIFILIAQLDKM